MTALIGLVSRNKRRYGGYIAHLGFVLICLGFAGDGFKRDETVLLKPGQQTTVGKLYTLRNEGLKISDDGQKQMTTAIIAVFVDGKQVDTLYPAKWAYRKHEQEPTTEVAIRRTLAEDLYVVLAFQPSDLATQTATLTIVINPLVNWIWLGFGVLSRWARASRCCPSARTRSRSRRCPSALRRQRRRSRYCSRSA